MIARFAVLLLFLALSPVGSAASPPTIVVLGDSISAGYGLASGEVWVTLLERRLKEQRYPHRVVNASISGDTTAGGRARLPQLLKEHKPAIVIIELGGNDALRGQPLAGTRANVDAMTVAAQSAGAKVLIVALRIPSNYGPMYTREFERLFADVAKARKTAFVPYLFEGFGEDLSLFQSDQIHPTREAQAKMLDTLWPALLPLLGAPGR
jgi:acyl-CoA thioesterase I